MKKYFAGMLALSIAFIAILGHAQNDKNKKNVYKGKTLWSDGVTGTGKISKQLFDSMLDQRLVALDSAGNKHPVLFHLFMYAERGLFEDSMGKLRIMTDHYILQCDNGKLPQDWVTNLRQRSKAGDTVYYNNVISSYDDSGRYHFYSEPLKLIITE